MSRKLLVMLTLCIFFVSAFNSNSLAWDNEVTHKDLSKYAAENSVLSKNKGDYLVNLGFNNGLDEYFQWSNDKKKIREWIRDGAFYEDAGSTWQGIAGTARYNNHFHNPLKLWLEAGLDDLVESRHYTGESSLIWAQDTTKQSNWLGGDWTWQAARIFFYNALTKNTDTERQAYFAQTFRGLGHQMHLIQDASQPDHVRNDAHPWDHNQAGGFNLEPWAKERSSDINALAANPIIPTLTLDPSAYSLDPSYYSRSLTPVALFVDTDQYNGTAPSIGLTQGIAEYTNANFASEHTIFTEETPTNDKHYFPYPRKSSTDIQNYINQNKLPETKPAEDGIADVGFWIAKTGDGENYNHFAKPTYLTKPLQGTALYYKTFYQDTECHKDYAGLLIPRAVGYSAGLLNYFFRGTIELTLPTNGIYSSATGTYPGFTTIKVLARNITPNNEPMSDLVNGSIKLVVRYKLAHTDPFQSLDVATDDEFTYLIAPEANNVRSVPTGSTVELTFDLSQTPLPFWATNVYLQVVYRGKLGNEEGAVAVGFKDISEPTPIDLYNNMDKLCLNGAWYDAGSQLAIDQAPVGWDVYPHDIQTGYLKISFAGDMVYASPSDYTFSTGTIPPRTLYRAYVLSDYDYPFKYSDNISSAPTSTRDTADHSNAILIGSMDGSAIKNQVVYQVTNATECAEVGATAPCDIRYYPLFYTFRGTRMWGAAGFIADNPKYPANTSCSWGALN